MLNSPAVVPLILEQDTVMGMTIGQLLRPEDQPHDQPQDQPQVLDPELVPDPDPGTGLIIIRTRMEKTN